MNEIVIVIFPPSKKLTLPTGTFSEWWGEEYNDTIYQIVFTENTFCSGGLDSSSLDAKLPIYCFVIPTGEKVFIPKLSMSRTEVKKPHRLCYYFGASMYECLYRFMQFV